jgi:hypothetical protein
LWMNRIRKLWYLKKINYKGDIILWTS